MSTQRRTHVDNGTGMPMTVASPAITGDGRTAPAEVIAKPVRSVFAKPSPKAGPWPTVNLALYVRTMARDVTWPSARRVVRHHGYELEVVLSALSHTLLFSAANAGGVLSVAEVVAEDVVPLPSAGQAMVLMCPSEKDVEHTEGRAPGPVVHYMCSIQTEVLPDTVYASTYEELRDFGRAEGALLHLWQDAAGPCLSMVDVQRHTGEVHAQCYHAVATGGFVLRTQTIFEVMREKRD